ncbi:MAG: bacterial Ig-like domain-containing protein, partial [Clostridia bacterium]
MKSKKLLVFLILILVMVLGLTLVACKDTVVPDKQITSISVTGVPSDIALNQNLDLSQAQIVVYYDNDTSENITLTESQISGFDATILGKQTITITYNGKTYDVEINVIAPIEIKVNESISVAAVANVESAYQWTGEEIKPVPTVTLGSKVLVLNTDYEISYSKNITISTNDDRATITITGIGSYEGNITKTFFVIKRIVNPSDVLFENNLVFNGNEQMPIFTNNSENLYSINDPQTNAGSYHTEVLLTDPVHYQWSENDNYYINWTIAKKSIDLPIYTEGNFVYDGTEQTVNITANSDYTIGDECKE